MPFFKMITSISFRCFLEAWKNYEVQYPLLIVLHLDGPRALLT